MKGTYFPALKAAATYVLIISLVIFSLTGCKKDSASVLINPCGIDFETTVHYVAIGDEFSSGVHIAPSTAWPYQLVDLMHDQGHIVSEFSFIGAEDLSSSELESSLNSSNNTDCKNLVTLMAGVHDQLEQKSLAEFRADYTSLLQKAITVAGTSDRLICLAIPDYSISPGLPASAGTPESAGQMILDYNEIIAEECETAGVHFADIYPISHSAYQILYVEQDEFHPDEDHHSLWANLVFGVAQSILD